MADDAVYRIVTLPPLPAQIFTTPDAKIAAFAQKFRELRLRALKVNPDAFARLYEEELQWGLEKTFERLANPHSVTFLAVKKKKKTTNSDVHDDENEKIATNDSRDPFNPDLISSLLEDEWLGNVVLQGPQEDDGLNPREFPVHEPFPRLAADGTRIPPRRILFRVGGTFVDPAGRGRGLGGRLMNAASDWARAEGVKYAGGSGGERVGVRVGLAVYGHNVAAIGMYAKAGYRVVEERASLSRVGMVALIMENVLVEGAR